MNPFVCSVLSTTNVRVQTPHNVFYSAPASLPSPVHMYHTHHSPHIPYKYPIPIPIPPPASPKVTPREEKLTTPGQTSQKKMTSRNCNSPNISMAPAQLPVISLLFLGVLLLLCSSPAHSATFTITNKCSYSVWPGLLSNAGTPQLPTTGFALQPGESNTISVPQSWSGRLWGRTLCSQDPTTGKFSCQTGDCGSSTVECAGRGAAPPATLAELTLDGADGMDFYDVSLVDGYNLPMLVAPQGGTAGNCTTTGCGVDLNDACPSDLKVTSSAGSGEEEGAGSTVACRSACDAFGDPQYCCSGAYSTPNTCKPSSYSQFFKSECPRAYSYAYDDGTSIFTCAGANYAITFCPSPITNLKSTDGGNEQYPEAAQLSAGTRNPFLIGSAGTLAIAIWQLLWQLL